MSGVALGTMDSGHLLDESTSFHVMDAAVNAGINHFDTADVHGGPQAADMANGYGVSRRDARAREVPPHAHDVVP